MEAKWRKEYLKAKEEAKLPLTAEDHGNAAVACFRAEFGTGAEAYLNINREALITENSAEKGKAAEH